MAKHNEKDQKVQIITDDNGNKQVVLSLEYYEQLMEDLEDLGVAAERRGDDSIPFEDVKAELREDGLL